MSGSVGGISVPIFAVDHATAVINQVGRNIAGMGASSRRATNVSGVDRLTLSMHRLGNRTFEAFRSMDRLVPPLAVLTGALSLAGMGMLIQRFGELGTQADNVSIRLGITAEKLTGLQGAADLGGSSANDMASALGALDEKLRGATFRGDGVAIQSFAKLGVSFGQIGAKARTSGEAIYETADAIKHLYQTEGRGAALRAAQGVGLEGIFPLIIREGGAGIRALEAKTKRLSGVLTEPMIRRADALRESFRSVGIAAEGLANHFVDALAPSLTPVLEQFATFIARGSKWIDLRLPHLMERFATWLKTADFSPLADAAERFFTWVDSLTQKDFTEFGKQIQDIGTDISDAYKAADRFATKLLEWKVPDAVTKVFEWMQWIGQYDPTKNIWKFFDPLGDSGSKSPFEEWLQRMRGSPGGKDLGTFLAPKGEAGASGAPGDPSVPRGIRNNNPGNIEFAGTWLNTQSMNK